MTRDELEGALFRILRTLEGYRDELILVGGWVPYLQLRYGEPAAPEATTSLTTEADLLVPAVLPRGDRPPLAELLRKAGFHPRGDAGVMWAREPEQGETIEFLQAHVGPARRQARGVEIGGQPDLRALSLDHLWILASFTDRLTLAEPGGSEGAIAIRVPTLAAFLLNKANTFSLRGGPDRAVKAGKDLLYLRDIIRADASIEASVRADLERMLTHGSGRKVARLVRRAIVHLERTTDPFAQDAARILAERDGMPTADARADVVGHLRDVLELLEGVAQE